MVTDSKLIPHALILCIPLGIATAGAFAFARGLGASLSSALGTAMGAGNLWVMSRLTSTVLSERNAQAWRIPAAILFSAKTVVLLIVLALIFATGHVYLGAFITGLLMVVVSIVLAAFGPGGTSSEGRSLF